MTMPAERGRMAVVATGGSLNASQHRSAPLRPAPPRSAPLRPAPPRSAAARRGATGRLDAVGQLPGQTEGAYAASAIDQPQSLAG